MQRLVRSVSAGALATALAASACIALAQTPAQMEYDRQQREYWRQQEQQRQEQQRQQQLMQDNARRQQEESSRINAPQGQGSAGGGQGGAAAQGRGGSQAAADNLSAARAAWEKKPPLPPDKNPLLGKWTRPQSGKANSSDPFAQLQALAKGGLCEVLFGGGTFEFKPDKLVGMDERTREQELDRVEYRGDAKHVVVLPKTTIKLMEWDFDGPNRINWKSQNCVLVRVGAPSSAAASSGAPAAGPGASGGAAASVAGAAATTAASARGGSAAGAGGKLDLAVAALAPGYNVAGRKLWVLKEDAQVALIKGGVTSTPDASVLQNWIRACTSHAPLCEKGANALKAYSVGLATTDATGHALTPPLPPGRYWVLADAKVANKRVVWNTPVDVKGGDKSLTLDARNAMPVD
jgi:hypothetical protein